ncbi:MAG: DUF3307 domain-containing protein [Ignavibacteriales bacterium]|nr:DUF3307 domain-containing protein [Ignavibacteriales bacterium]
MEMGYLILTLVLLNFCHFIGDFSHLNTNWMIKAKKIGKPLFPLLCHAGVHAILFFITILILFNFDMAFYAASIQLVSHFIIDFLKGKLGYWFSYIQNSENRSYWLIFGFDQFLHQLVIVGIIAVICYS